MIGHVVGELDIFSVRVPETLNGASLGLHVTTGNIIKAISNHLGSDGTKSLVLPSCI